jgi:hypothetical protein
MTSQKLYEILCFLDDLDKTLGLQATLETVRETLTNLASAPANVQHQSTLAASLEAFSAGAAKLSQLITPSQAAAIKQMGGEEFFSPGIAEKVKESVQKNAMTPSVPRDFVQNLAAKRAAFLETVRSARQNLENLGIRESKLKPDSADIAFLIPRDIFENHLGDFARELTFISRLMQDVSEAVTGEVQPAELEQLSSSIPTVALLAGVGVISAIATVVNKFLEAWEKIEKIRRIRTDLMDIGMKGTAVEELTEQITTTVDEVVEESTQTILARYSGNENRKNELENAIRQDTRRLFGQIERGLTVEFRVEPKADGKGENQVAFKTITDLNKTMQFPDVAREPMLLENGEIIEGEIHVTKHSKKTQKTTTSKKEVAKETKSEEKK